MDHSNETVVIDEKMQEEISEKMRSFMGVQGLTSITVSSCLSFIERITNGALFENVGDPKDILSDFGALNVIGRILLNANGISNEEIDNAIGKTWFSTNTTADETLKKLKEKFDKKEDESAEESEETVS